MKLGLGHSHEIPIGHSVEVRHGLFLKHEALIHASHEKAVALVKREAVNPADYHEVYSLEKIQHEEEEARNKKSDFEHPDPLVEEASLIAEAVIYDQVGRHDWLSAPGVHVYVEKTADIDDIFNQTDVVLTFETAEGEKPLAVTVDVTISTKKLKEKVHSIKQEIDKQELTTIRYHEKPSGERGPLEKTPRVVVGIEADTLVSLLPLWVEGDTESKERLKKHPVQADIAREIVVQLEAYEKYAREKGKAEIADRFLKALVVLRAVCEERERQVGRRADNEEASVVQGMRRALDSVLRSVSSEKVLHESPAEERRRKESLKRLRP